MYILQCINQQKQKENRKITKIKGQIKKLQKNQLPPYLNGTITFSVLTHWMGAATLRTATFPYRSALPLGGGRLGQKSLLLARSSQSSSFNFLYSIVLSLLFS